MDFVGPIPMSENGNTFTFVMVDQFTGWPIVYAVDNTEADRAAKKVQELIHTYGRPDSLLSGKGGHLLVS